MMDSKTNEPVAHTADYQLSAYRYHLPESMIAQNPVTPRDHSKLLVIDSPTTHQHAHFYDLVDWLAPGDLLILKNTKVIPARIRPGFFTHAKDKGNSCPALRAEINGRLS